MSLSSTARLLVLLTVYSSSLVAAEEPAAETEAKTDVWVTSLAHGSDDARFAGTATGLLLRPADVVRWTGDDFAGRTTVMTHPAAVWCVSVCDDGGHVASADYRGNLQTFDVADGKATMYEGIFERWTQAMRFAPTGDTIVAGNEAGKLFVFDSGKVTKTIDVDKNAITDIAFNAAANKIAVSDGGGHVHFYSWPELADAGKVVIGDEPAWSVRFYAISDTVLVGSGDRKLYRCEAKADAKPEVVMHGMDWVTRLAISDAGAIAVGEIGGSVYILPNATPRTESISPVGKASSGVWSLDWVTPSELVVGTRKDGIMTLKQSWAFTPSPTTSQTKAEDEQ